MNYRKRRLIVSLLFALAALGGAAYDSWQQSRSAAPLPPAVTQSEQTQLATAALEQLELKGRAPRTGYSRQKFGDGWEQLGSCSIRDHILNRDMTDVQTKSAEDCDVVSGTLNDPYTGKVIKFVRGPDTSDDVQIDHVVALSDAWQKGAQQLSQAERLQFANDPLNLLAVEGATNQQKGDGDAASWLPPNKPYRCRYLARQIAVKLKYKLWVTEAEKSAMARVLATCPDQILPVVQG